MLLSLAENGIKKKEDLCISIHLVFQVKGTLKAIRHMYTPYLSQSSMERLKDKNCGEVGNV